MEQNKPRVAGDYTILMATQIGGLEIVLGEHKAPGKEFHPYLVASCTSVQLGTEMVYEYSPLAYSTGYLDAMRDYAGQITRMVDVLELERAKRAIPQHTLTTAHCLTGSTSMEYEADEMVKETIYFSSEAAKLAGLGIKNLAALLWAMAKDHERSPGRTKIANLMANTKMPRVVHIKPEDRQTFEALAKKSGIVFAPPITYKKVKEDMLHYVFAGESTEQMNLVLEQLGYHKLKEREGKNGEERAAPSERSSSERERTGDTATSTKTRDGQQDAGFHAEPGGAPSGAGGRKSPGQEGSVGAQFAVFMSRSKASAKPGRGAGPDLSR